jgi:hypothetical protein
MTTLVQWNFKQHILEISSCKIDVTDFDNRL